MFVLLESATASGNGTWAKLNNTKKVSIHVVGLGTGNLGTVLIHGANVVDSPAASTHHVTLLTATTEALLVLDSPVRWVKARVSNHIATGSASISTFVVGGYDG